MRAIQSGAYPIDPGTTAALSTQSPMVFGSSPYLAGYDQSPGFTLRAFDPGRAVYGPGNVPVFGIRPGNMRGMKGGCGCSAVDGCGCASLSGLKGEVNAFGIQGLAGVRGLRQNVSLDQLIQAATNYATGVAQASLPASAAVPPQFGSGGAIATQLMNLLPYLIGGYLLYKVIK